MSEFKEHKFNIGDKVICTNTIGVNNTLTTGKEYEVLGLAENRITIIMDNGWETEFHNKRFKLKEHRFKVGDKVICIDNSGFNNILTIGKEYEVLGLVENTIKIMDNGLCLGFQSGRFKLKEPKTFDRSGGPSEYYDLPFKDFVTTQDLIEYLAKEKWGADVAVNFKDVLKALCRWGDKKGTSTSYDAKKVMYYSTRVLKIIVGISKTREYLQSLLDDEQFKEKDNK